MKLSRLFHTKKSRKYPIKRDREGLSLRARCFVQFEQGKRPVEVAEELRIKETTVHRYFRDWKRLGSNFEGHYAFVKELFKKNAFDRDNNIELFATTLGIGKGQFEAILSQPHGLRRLMTGKLYFPANADADRKRTVALELALLISDHLVKNRGKFEDVYYALLYYMQKNMEYRENEAAYIKEDNQTTALMHRILAKDVENERLGRVKPDRLSVEEIGALLRFELVSLKREKETSYWRRIAVLMSDGLTLEQAREKVYQDLIEKGNVEGAKVLLAYQDIVHPVKAGDQVPPPSPPQPPPPT